MDTANRGTGVLLLLGLAHSLNHSLFLVLPPLLEEITRDLGASYQTIGAVATVSFLLYGAGALVGGPLSDRVGYVRISGVAVSVHGPGTDGLDGALEAAFAGVGEDAAVIYLQHAPGNEVSAAAAGAGLMLDGHTHGAQIWPAHFVVRRIYPHMAGVRKVGDMTQVVSRGAGRWGPPMRLFAPSEIYRITLRNSRGG